MSFEWINCTLGDCVDVSQGLAINVKSKHLLVDAGLPLLRITDMFNDTYAQFVDTDKAPKKCIAEPEDIIYSRTGQVGFVFTGKKGVVHNNCFKVEPIKPELTKKFVYWFLRQESVRDYANSIASGSVQKDLNHSAFKSIEFSYPSPAAQNRICTLLDTLDSRISLLRETNATLEAIAQALFKSWFVDFDPVHANAAALENKEQAPSLPPAIQALFPATFTDSPQGPIPEGWSWKTLDEAYEINPKRLLKKGALAKYLDMASVQTQGHVTEDVIERAFGSGTKFCNGDTLLARITPCLENGKTAFVDFLEPNETGWGSTEFVILKPKAPLPDFHGYLLARQSVFREFAIRSMSGTSGRQRVQNDVLGSFYLAIPDEPIAAAFAQIVTPIQQSISANHKQAKTLAALRDTLLPRLISGKLRLPDAQVTLEEDIYAAK